VKPNPRLPVANDAGRNKQEIPFDWILGDVLDKPGPFEFILTETTRCRNCRPELLEKSLVEVQVESTSRPRFDPQK